jgi:hypothetical protein
LLHGLAEVPTMLQHDLLVRTLRALATVYLMFSAARLG